MASASTGSPIDDLTYDVITVLQKKARALEAYDKYLSDADSEDDTELRDLFSSMRRQDEEDIQILKEVLARRLEDDLGYESEEEDETEEEEDYEEADDAEIEDTAPGRVDAGAAAKTEPPGRGESTQRQR